MNRLTVLLSATCLALLAVSANANSLTNGSFELGTFVNDGNGTDTFNAGATTISGWTVVGRQVSWIETPNPWGLSPEDGSRFLDLTAYTAGAPFGGVTQSIATIIGQQYVLTFDLGSYTSVWGGPPVSILASAGGTSQTFTDSAATNASTWVPFSLNFTATSVSTAITLTGAAGVSYIGLDTVSVDPGVAAVAPEPGPFALLTLGLGVLLLVIGRRRASPWRKLVSIAIAFAASIPTYADAVVQGAVFTNLTTTNTDVYNSDVVIGPPTSQTVNWSYTCTTCTGYGLSASGSAKVIDGVLGAMSTVSVTGTPGSSYSAEADSYAQFTDNLTITGGTGTGVLALMFATDGSISNTGTGYNGSYVYLALFDASGVYSAINGGPATNTDIQYFTSDTNVTFYVPFTFGTQFSIEPVMRAAAQDYQAYDVTPYTATSNFYSTATLASALVFDGTPTSLGNQVSNADISSTTGFSYGPSGLSAVPEPGTWLPAALVLAALWLARRRLALLHVMVKLRIASNELVAAASQTRSDGEATRLRASLSL
jgi:hypothetical protein